MEGERKSSIHQIRGGDEEWRKTTENKFANEFTSRWRMKKMERKKTPEEQKIIRPVIQMVGEYLQQYGARPLKITGHNIHVLDGSKMSAERRREIEGANIMSGGYIQLFQLVVIPDWKFDSPLAFARTLTHELVHFYSFNGAAKIEGETIPRTHRVGLDTSNLKTEYRRYFEALNEAVTEELVRRFYPQLKRISTLAKEVDEVENVQSQYKVPEVSSVIVRRIAETGDEQFEASVKHFSYAKERKQLYALIDEIYAHNPDRFADKEQIFSVFARAAMTGDIKEMAALVEGLGHGRLRQLAQIKAA